MTGLTTHAAQTGTYAISRQVGLSRLPSMIEAVTGWYQRKMRERALEGLSMSELKDIGYPTVDDDDSCAR